MQNFKQVSNHPYLKSAGKLFLELMVVAFGVYLGFMANSNAEAQKEKVYVNATIKEMYSSLGQDIKDAELNQNGHSRGLRAIQYFFNLLQNRTVNVDSFLYYQQILTRNYVSVQNTSPFETIRSRGFDVISNDSLRRQMIKVYDFQYEVLEKVEEKYQESQLYANESAHVNEIIDNSLVFDDNFKVSKVTLPLKITNEERNRMILILKRMNYTRIFNISVYEGVIGDMKKLRTNIATVYPFVLLQ